MKKSSKMTHAVRYEPGKVILMSVIVAVLTIVMFASIGLMTAA